jgi:hypothetical protein
MMKSNMTMVFSAPFAALATEGSGREKKIISHRGTETAEYLPFSFPPVDVKRNPVNPVNPV